MKIDHPAATTVEILGSGTSTGVPQLLCNCPVCQSSDKRDKRLRQSAIIKHCGMNLLIDCGPDFRTQMLRAASQCIDALLVTHIDYDHLAGLDDLRPYALGGTPFPIYAKEDVLKEIKRKMPYCFEPHRYPGAPRLELHEVNPHKPFCINGIEVIPIEVTHHIPILGYRIGPVAYITDCKCIAPEQAEKLNGVTTLIINALRFAPHPTHFSVDDAITLIEQVNPQKAFLIHMSHEIGLHEVVQKRLPKNVILAYDGLIINA